MSITASEIPFITTEAMREVDRLMIEELKIDLLQMMENAGRALANLCRSRFLHGDVLSKRILILAGRGANGGGALVCARRLHGWGARVQVLMPVSLDIDSNATARQLNILYRIGVSVEVADMAPRDFEYDVIIDGLIGYGLRGEPYGKIANLITFANSLEAPILALDVPSGLDATTGEVHEPCIKAQATMTLALPKIGLKASEARNYVGELFLADIGVPINLYGFPSINLEVPALFSKEDIVRLW